MPWNYWVRNDLPVVVNTDCKALSWSLTAVDVYVAILQTKKNLDCFLLDVKIGLKQ